MAQDIFTALRGLANRWTLKARDFARQSKEAGDNEAQAQYNRGYAEGYYRAATELAALIKEQETAPQSSPQPKPAAPLPPQGGRRSVTAAPQHAAPASAPVVPAASTVIYASVTVREAQEILVYGGCQPQVVNMNKDNSFRATFSSWGSMMPHEQLARVQKADPRIIILNSGKMELHDYFIDFAFKES